MVLNLKTLHTCIEFFHPHYECFEQVPKNMTAERKKAKLKIAPSFFFLFLKIMFSRS